MGKTCEGNGGEDRITTLRYLTHYHVKNRTKVCVAVGRIKANKYNYNQILTLYKDELYNSQ